MKLYSDNDKRLSLEDSIISCILQKNELINELYIDPVVFRNEENFRMINFFRKFYKEHKTLDITLLCSVFKEDGKKDKMLNYWEEHYNMIPDVDYFYQYQEQLQETYKENEIENLVEDFKSDMISKDEFIEKINDIQNKSLIVTNNCKKITPDEMLQKIRNKEKNISFKRLWGLNEKIKIKKRTLNVIAARPSEGKSALALNLFCDLSKEYKTIYFNMEMTEEEVYERMLGIESGLPISHIVIPDNAEEEQKVNETANRIFNMNYQVINGSMNIKGLKSKIIKEQRDEHLIVFIDYVGYITTKAGQSDKDRIGEVTRELNNITKDYNCTIFLIAQINRNGSDVPTMQDLKDSGELEQSADTIILIHDENKKDTAAIKNIKFLVPKCRGSRRNVAVNIKYNKTSQRMEVVYE